MHLIEKRQPFSLLATILLFMVFARPTFAQDVTKIGVDNDFEGIIYKKEFSMSAKMHTNGFGVSANFVKLNSFTKKSVIEIELMDLKHPKEFRQQSLFASGRNVAKGFVYGKQNSFYNINASVGRIKSIAEKGQRNGVQMALYYAGGISLGISRPYYLDLITGISPSGNLIHSSQRYEDGSEGNAALFLNDNQIYGASSFINGWNKISFYPGAQGKVGLSFDWSNYDEFIKAIEVGAMLNVYAKRVPILITANDDVKNRFIYPNFYLRFIVGKRSN